MKRCFTQKVIHVLVTVVTLTSVVMLAPTNQAHAEIDRIDTTFNGVGYVTHNGAAGGNGADLGGEISVQNDGKYVIAGYSYNAAGNGDMAIWRYNANGTLDATFNSVGYVTHNGAAGGNGNDYGKAMVIQSGGKYVIVGLSRNVAGNDDMVIWRYNADGTLDTTFGGIGYVTHHGAAGGNGNDSACAVVIQSDGKYVIAGSSRNVAGNDDMVIWRYNADGTLDTTFGGVGYVAHNGASGVIEADVGYSVAIQSDGKYIVGGYSMGDMAIWRYGSDGTMDSAFGDGSCHNGVGEGGAYGCVHHNSAAGGNSVDAANSMTLQADGKIVVGGYSINAVGNTDIAIWRYTDTGWLDSTFSNDGVYTNSFSTQGSLADKIHGNSAMYLDENGKLIVAAYTIIGDTSINFTLIRFTPEGVLDTSFNTTGYYECLLTAGNDVPYSIAYEGNGRFVLSGYSTGTNLDMTIWRFEVLYQTTPPAGLVPKVGSTDVSIGGPDGVYADDTETILYSSDIPIAGAAVDYTEDLDWSGVAGGTDAVNYKSFVSGLYGADGVDGTVTLYVPYRDGDDSVGICPGATSLAEVGPTCTGLIGKQESDADTELVTINNVRYWKVSGLTGTGGFSGRGLAETGANILLPTLLIGIPTLMFLSVTIIQKRIREGGVR